MNDRNNDRPLLIHRLDLLSKYGAELAVFQSYLDEYASLQIAYYSMLDDTPPDIKQEVLNKYMAYNNEL